MRFDFVRLAKLDVDATAISKSPGLAGREVLVGVGNALEILQLKLVFFCIRIGIAATPEVLNKLLALLIGFEFLPRVAFGLCEDGIDVIQPLDIGLIEFALNLAWLFVRTGLGLLS